MQVGAFGIGSIHGDGPLLDAMDAFTPTCFTSHSNDGLTQLGLTANTGITSIVVNRGSRPTRIHQAYILRRTWFSYYGGSSWSYQEAYTTGNTTKASDGTLKAASPVAQRHSFIHVIRIVLMIFINDRAVRAVTVARLPGDGREQRAVRTGQAVNPDRNTEF